MEHLMDEYGPIVLPVPLVTERRHCDPIKSLEEFFAFPDKHGWCVGEDYSLNEKLDTRAMERLDKSILLQSWLFFGLISLVVQDVEGAILKFDDLTDRHYLDTSQLRDALATWEAYEIKNRETAQLRMVRTELALEKAQRVVRKNCTFDLEEPEGIQSNGTDESDGTDDEVNLALMVLGETLSAAKARILDGVGSKMRGWHRNEEGGWGPPRFVFQKMKARMWCPRTIHLIHGQLGSYATLLLAAFESQDKEHGVNRAHRLNKCTKEVCKVIAGDDAANALLGSNVLRNGTDSPYVPQHERRCENHATCQMIGPDMDEVYAILKEQNDHEGPKKIPRFPIMEVIEGVNNNLEIKVKAWSSTDRNTTFATISHVWSDGLGNEDNNKIYYCQFQFISQLLEKVVDLSDIGGEKKRMPFWMDTLLIPVKSKEPGATVPSDFDNLKQRAIRQIYHVFSESAHSIIIDKGLLSLDSKGRPWKNVMKILASGWMRRLWTLQEAFLSKRLWITFKQPRLGSGGMEDFDKLVKSMVDTQSLTSSFAEMARLKLLQNILGEERDKRNDGSNFQDFPHKGAILIANTWRAARWRTTSNPAHETLALATLLNLDYRGSSISNAGLKNRKDVVTKEQLGDMMSDFWETLNRDIKGSIPPGIIFLPGEKLSKKGFRWAPSTWMSALESDHPDPLNTFNCVTDLDAKYGLVLEYPGFLLHCQDRKVVLGTDRVDPTFTFPVDRDLLEWYSVEPADKERKTYIYQILERSNGESTDLAIILSRTRPRETPAEIGLLVEIYEKREQQATNGLKRTRYCCRVIHRVRVKRAKPLYGYFKIPATTEAGLLSRRSTALSARSADNGPPSVLQAPSENDNQICIGELIDSDQAWCVDGFDPPTTTAPNIGPSINQRSIKSRALSLLWSWNPSARWSLDDTTASSKPQGSMSDASQNQQC